MAWTSERMSSETKNRWNFEESENLFFYDPSTQIFVQLEQETSLWCYLLTCWRSEERWSLRSTMMLIWNISENFTISLALKFSWNVTVMESVSPRVSRIYNIRRRWTDQGNTNQNSHDPHEEHTQRLFSICSRGKVMIFCFLVKMWKYFRWYILSAIYKCLKKFRLM